MTLLQKYIDAAEATLVGAGMDAKDAMEYIKKHVEVSPDEPRTLDQLMGDILTGKIEHYYDGDCPDRTVFGVAPWGCNDEGCVACLIQHDWLMGVLGEPA